MSAEQRLLLMIYGDPTARPGWKTRTSGAGMLFCLGHRFLVVREDQTLTCPARGL